MQDLVSEMIMAISEAKTIPASGKVIVDREQMLQTLAVIEDRLPEEMRAARWMVREREIFVARTNERVRDLVQRARQKADEMISDTNIIAEATEEANILVRRAEDNAHRIRLEAEDYVEDRLERLETLLARVVDQIRSMRTELRQTRPRGG
jgi:vacuolar-type H+-ATPase subunit H